MMCFINTLQILGENCFKNNKEYSGDFVGNPVQVDTRNDCVKACKAKSGCKFFSFRNRRECVLMKNQKNINSNNGVVSGAIKDCETRKPGE